MRVRGSESVSFRYEMIKTPKKEIRYISTVRNDLTPFLLSLSLSLALALALAIYLCGMFIYKCSVYGRAGSIRFEMKCVCFPHIRVRGQTFNLFNNVYQSISGQLNRRENENIHSKPAEPKKNNDNNNTNT